jgi:hypothetical protein
MEAVAVVIVMAAAEEDRDQGNSIFQKEFSC